MRVLKQKDQSFLAGVFGLQGKLFFSAAGLLFFDLEHPETPLPEKELWALVKKRVGKAPPFDAAMPKAQGEVLVYGACHRTEGHDSLEAGEVALTLGDVRKRLYVFGPRHWGATKEGRGIVHEQAPPEPVPLTWQNAYGGGEYLQNPLGLGAASVTAADGSQRHPLPRVEYPEALIGSPDDAPPSAAMAPVDPTWPQRMALAGTYDDAWLREHWPHFPEDFDLRFFSTAPEDQQAKGYFRGDEAIRLQGMHPLRPVISSRLPGLRIRCFATLYDDARHRGPEDKTSFQELETNLDTVWLFPEEMRGVCCFRGVCEIKDEEYRDVGDVLLVTESLDASKQPLEHYQELRDTWVERTLKLDASRVEEGKQAVADALNKVKGLPAEIQKRLDKGLGKSPRLPVTPDQQVAAAHGRLDAAATRLDRMEAMALDMRAKHGHMAAIDLGPLARMRQSVAKQRKTLQDMQKRVNAAQKEIQEQRQVARQKLVKQKQELEAQGVEANFDPDDAVLPPREKRWPTAVLGQLGPWRQALLDNKELYNALLGLGLTEESIAHALLGYNPAPLDVQRKLWGLEPAEALFTIPAGLVLPQFEEATPVALHIRPLQPGQAPFPPGGNEVLVEGSCPLEKAPFLAAGAKGRLLTRVGDPLEALLLAQEAGDLSTAIVLDAPDTKLAEAGEALLQDAPGFVVALHGPEAKDVEKQWRSWSEAWPDAVRLPLPTGGVFQAKGEGRSIRELLRRALPREVEEALPAESEAPLTAADVRPGMPLPFLELKRAADGSGAQAKSAMEATAAKARKEAQQARDTAMQQSEEKLRSHGLDPEQYLQHPAAKAPFDAANEKKKMLAQLDMARKKLEVQQQLTPEIEKELESAATCIGALLDKAVAMPLGGDIPVPDWARKLRARHGLDPETGKGLTREQVAAMLANGELDFTGRDVSGLDLSGLDFSGATFDRAVCRETSFKGCSLKGGSLRRALCAGTDFTGGTLSGADLRDCVLQKALLANANLSATRCAKALFAEADCSGANFSNADMGRAVLLETRMPKACFAGAKAARAVFKLAVLSGADFTGTDLSDAVFIKCSLDGLDFSDLTMRRVVFMACTGKDVLFSGAEMENARLLKGCSLPGAIFAKARLNRVSAMECGLQGCNFSGAVLDKALLQECDLAGATFFRARARHARLLTCNLEKANMRGLDLLHGSLRKTRLVESDLTGANLFGADVYKVVMGDTVLDLADTRRTLLEKREGLLPTSGH